MASVLSKIMGAGSGADVKRYMGIVDKINSLEPDLKKMDDRSLARRTLEFRERIENGEDYHSLIPDVFATVREAAVRSIGMRHYDVQLIAGLALAEGKIAEAETGAGKTLISTLPVYLGALYGQGYHVITVNDYLAKRDAYNMGRVHDFMGLRVGLLQADMSPQGRHNAYNADLTYGTNSEFGFDYLRDHMAMSKNSMVQRGHKWALVDEVDSILIDEARTPLIISGATDVSMNLYKNFANAVRGLVDGEDIEIDEAKKTVMATDSGLIKIEKRLGIDNLYGDNAAVLVNMLQQALKAEYLFHNNKDYIVSDGTVKIVDEFTGRIMEGRQWSDGLHQAVEAKEGVEVQPITDTLATVTLQNYFRLYDHLAGMTGTAMTEDAEFREIYNLPVVAIPPNKPIIRKDQKDVIYRTEEAKYNAVADDIVERHKKGQPVLAGTTTVEYSEYLSKLLDDRGIEHQVLNAKNHEKEAHIVAQAGRFGAVTIATNMAGRGTDILLGGNADVMAEDILIDEGIDLRDATEEEKNAAIDEAKAICDEERKKVLDVGGLYVIGTERHESRRIDNQLRGRSGRQGDPGESRFYLSLEDNVMRLFGGDRMKAIGNMLVKAGIPDSEPISANGITKAIEKAQLKIEDINFGIRKNVLEYDDVMDKQRKAVYNERDAILNGKSFNPLDCVDSVVDSAVDKFMSNKHRDTWDIPGYMNWLDITVDAKVSDDEWDKEKGTKEELAKLSKEKARTSLEKAKSQFDEIDYNAISRQVLLKLMDICWMTYLQEIEYLKTGIGLRGFGQRDPLVEYKQEAYVAFQDLINAVYNDFVQIMTNIERDTPDNYSETNPLDDIENEICGNVDVTKVENERIAKDSNISREEEKKVATVGNRATRRKKAKAV